MLIGIIGIGVPLTYHMANRMVASLWRRSASNSGGRKHSAFNANASGRSANGVRRAQGAPPKPSKAAPHSYDLKAGGRDVDWMEALSTTCNTTLVLRPADSMYEFAVDGVLGATTLCFGDKGQVTLDECAIATLRKAARYQLMRQHAPFASSDLYKQCAEGLIPMYPAGETSSGRYAKETEAAIAIVAIVTASSHDMVATRMSGAIRLTDSELAEVREVMSQQLRERSERAARTERRVQRNRKDEGTHQKTGVIAPKGTKKQGLTAPSAAPKDGPIALRSTTSAHKALGVAKAHVSLIIAGLAIALLFVCGASSGHQSSRLLWSFSQTTEHIIGSGNKLAVVSFAASLPGARIIACTDLARAARTACILAPSPPRLPSQQRVPRQRLAHVMHSHAPLPHHPSMLSIAL